MTTVISIIGIITGVLLNNDLNILLTIEYKFILLEITVIVYLFSLAGHFCYSIKTCKHGGTVK